MFKLFSTLLERMGNWFGIIFKILLPAVIMYRPIKMVGFSLLVFGAILGGDVSSLNNFGIILFVIFYVVFGIMLILFPKAASALEFILILYYFGCIIAFGFSDFFTQRIVGIADVAFTYAKMAPFIFIFLLGKVLFFIFLKVNRDKIEQNRRKKFGFFDITM